MSFNEDYSRIRKENAPHIMAIFRHIALTLLQRAKQKNKTLRALENYAAGMLSSFNTSSLKNLHEVAHHSPPLS